MREQCKSVKISSELYKKIQMLAKDEGKFIGHILDRAIKNYLVQKKILLKE